MTTMIERIGPDPSIVEMLRRLNERRQPINYRRMRCRHCKTIIASPVFNCINSHCDLVEEPE